MTSWPTTTAGRRAAPSSTTGSISSYRTPQGPCCATSCQTTHSNGAGQSFYDCVPLGTYNLTQAQKGLPVDPEDPMQMDDSVVPLFGTPLWTRLSRTRS